LQDGPDDNKGTVGEWRQKFISITPNRIAMVVLSLRSRQMANNMKRRSSQTNLPLGFMEICKMLGAAVSVQ